MKIYLIPTFAVIIAAISAFCAGTQYTNSTVETKVAFCQKNSLTYNECFGKEYLIIKQEIERNTKND